MIHIFLTYVKFFLAFLPVPMIMVYYPDQLNLFNMICVSSMTLWIYTFIDKLLSIFFLVHDQGPRISKKIYVAGSWNHRHQLAEKMDELRSKGYTVTSYWPGLEDRMNNPDDYGECSKIDIHGVIDSDTVLAFMTDPMHPYCGTFTEIGCGIGSGKRIIVICDGKCTNSDSEKNYNFSHRCMQSVFFWDPRIEHVSDYEDALKLLEGQKVKSPFLEFYNGKISKKLNDFSSNLHFEH